MAKKGKINQLTFIALLNQQRFVYFAFYVLLNFKSQDSAL